MEGGKDDGASMQSAEHDGMSQQVHNDALKCGMAIPDLSHSLNGPFCGMVVRPSKGNEVRIDLDLTRRCR
jgi:hypothetical protein